jgi:putative hydrolase of the HAD superfamily
VLKPDPASYAHALEALGLDAAEVLFVDDQPANLDGARRAGLAIEPFDVTDPAASVARVRHRLGL